MKRLVLSILAASMVCSMHAANQATVGQALYNELMSADKMKKAADTKDMDQKQWAEFNDLVSQKMLEAATALQETKTDQMPEGNRSLRNKLDKIIDLQVVVLKKVQGK